MTKHTPGPWDVSNDGVIHNGETRIAQILRPNGYESDDEANADRIVACVNALEGFADPTAAPDLLEAVKHAHTSLRTFTPEAGESYWTSSDDDTLAALEAALAKAEGDQRMKTITRTEWNAKHNDYKGRRADGTRCWLELDPKTGATVSVPVRIEGET